MTAKFSLNLRSARWWLAWGCLLTFLLPVLAFLALLSIGKGSLAEGRFSGQEPTPLPSSTPTAIPRTAQSPARTSPPIPAAPVPTLAPAVHYFVWSDTYARGYLRDAPGGKILQRVANGIPLLISQVQSVGQTEWVHVAFLEGDQEVEGWMSSSLIVAIQSDLSLVRVSGDEGAYLRAEPQGRILDLLPVGTPVQVVETVEFLGTTWIHGVLPDQRQGWIANRLLSPLTP